MLKSKPTPTGKGLITLFVLATLMATATFPIAGFILGLAVRAFKIGYNLL